MKRNLFVSSVPVPVIPAETRHRVRNRGYQGIPGIAVMPGGRMFACAYSGGTGEGPRNYMMLFVSDDGGKTWSDAVAVVDPPQEDVRAFDGTLWVDPQGNLRFFWSQSYCARFAGGVFDGVGGVWMSRLKNPQARPADFRFTRPRRIAHGIMLNKPLVTSDGTWLLPASLWQQYTSRPDGMEPYRGAGCWSSCDNGKSFEFRGKAVIREQYSFDEHNYIELPDHRLWCVMRARKEAMESFSDDGGRTWSEPEPTSFCGFSRIFLRRLNSGAILRVENCNGENSIRRNNLTAFLSRDHGKTWSRGILLDARDEVSYPDAAQDASGRIFVIYDRHRAQGEILLASFTEKDFDLSPELAARNVVHGVVSRTAKPEQ